MTVSYLLRDVQPADIPFIFNSWLKSFRDAPAMASIPNSLYYVQQHALIERLMGVPGAVAVVACAEGDVTQIYGYVIGGASTLMPDGGKVALLHWLYVKHPFRGFGIGRALEAAVVHQAASVVYTHRVKSTERLLKSRTGYVYNPFLLMDVK